MVPSLRDTVFVGQMHNTIRKTAAAEDSAVIVKIDSRSLVPRPLLGIRHRLMLALDALDLRVLSLMIEGGSV
jgi:hypothetical protein